MKLVDLQLGREKVGRFTLLPYDCQSAFTATHHGELFNIQTGHCD